MSPVCRKHDNHFCIIKSFSEGFRDGRWGGGDDERQEEQHSHPRSACTGWHCRLKIILKIVLLLGRRNDGVSRKHHRGHREDPAGDQAGDHAGQHLPTDSDQVKYDPTLSVILVISRGPRWEAGRRWWSPSSIITTRRPSSTELICWSGVEFWYSDYHKYIYQSLSYPDWYN